MIVFIHGKRMYALCTNLHLPCKCNATSTRHVPQNVSNVFPNVPKVMFEQFITHLRNRYPTNSIIIRPINRSLPLHRIPSRGLQPTANIVQPLTRLFTPPTAKGIPPSLCRSCGVALRTQIHMNSRQPIRVGCNPTRAEGARTRKPRQQRTALAVEQY